MAWNLVQCRPKNYWTKIRDASVNIFLNEKNNSKIHATLAHKILSIAGFNWQIHHVSASWNNYCFESFDYKGPILQGNLSPKIGLGTSKARFSRIWCIYLLWPANPSGFNSGGNFNINHSFLIDHFGVAEPEEPKQEWILCHFYTVQWILCHFYTVQFVPFLYSTQSFSIFEKYSFEMILTVLLSSSFMIWNYCYT